MNVRYVSQSSEWNDVMKNQVEESLLLPLSCRLRGVECDLVLRLETAPRGQFEVWAFLQTFDDRHNEIVRREGPAPHALIEEVIEALLVRVSKTSKPLRLFNNPFDFLCERTA